MREWFEIIAANSQDAAKLGTPAVYTDDNGVDLTQMINKVLIGAVPYYQATRVYLGGLLEDENGSPVEGKSYTEMEHHWDEAFGYFGAARDYSRYSDDQTSPAELATTPSTPMETDKLTLNRNTILVCRGTLVSATRAVVESICPEIFLRRS